jgi:VWFA-related protein
MLKAVTVLFITAVLTATTSVGTQTPQFTARVDRVLADFTVVAKDGRPLTDLAVDGVQLKVDGRSRSIDSLQLVRVDPDVDPTAMPAGAPGSGAGKAIAAGHNPDQVRDQDGRQVFMVFDQASIRPNDERQAVEGAARFIDNLNERDRVALVSLPIGPNVELTRDRARIHAALDSVRGILPPPPRELPADKIRRACDDYDRTRSTIVRVRDLLDSMAAVDGLKTVVLVSAGLLPSGSEVPVGGAPGCAVTAVAPDVFHDLEIAAAAARAQFFVIQPHEFLIAAGDVEHGLPGFLGYPDYHAYLDGQLDGLQDVAGVTGGELFRLSGTADAVFKTIRLETSAYYVLAFAPTAAEADGKAHKIQIHVARKGVTVRARPSFTLARR